jgi:predicted HTH transcriptional regulator
MTNREFYTNIANGNVTEAEKEFALAAIAKMDETNEKRKNKVSPKEAEKQAEMAALRESIFAVITNDPQTEADIAAQVGVTGAKARAQLRKLVAEGKIVSADIKVPKKGTCKGYSLPATDVAEDVVEG